MKSNSKFRRMWKVLSIAFVIIIQIYWYKYTRKSPEAWEGLWESIGKRIRKTLFELEGLLIKIGQLLSIRSDLLPESFIGQIRDMTDNVPASEWEEIETILENEWGSSIEEHFSYIEKEAVASASIGEVYKGVLKDGTEVAVKVQRPNIDSVVETDFRTLKIIIWFVGHLVPMPKGFVDLKVFFNESKYVIERELDFTKEKNALLFFKKRFKDLEYVKIPGVFENLCTEKVLVMEWVKGINLTDQEAVDNLKVSRRELARRLVHLFLPQWLEAGVFHADPHSGNVLVSPEGEIILLDFGMVGEISNKDATDFQGLVESFLAKNYSKTIERLKKLGFLLPEADPRTIERVLVEWTSYKPADFLEMDMSALKMELADMIHQLPIQVPIRFMFLGRSMATLEGMMRNLVPEANKELLEFVKPMVMEWLDNQGRNKWLFLWNWMQSQPVFKVLHSATEFLTLPEKLGELKEQEQRRLFHFTIYENWKKLLFVLGIVGWVGVWFGLYAGEELLWQMAAGTAGIGLVGSFWCSYKQKKWLKYMNEKRR